MTAHRETFQTYDLEIDGVRHSPTYGVGQRITFPRIGLAIVREVHPFGTLHVESVETGNWFAVSGLHGTNWE